MLYKSLLLAFILILCPLVIGPNGSDTEKSYWLNLGYFSENIFLYVECKAL